MLAKALFHGAVWGSIGRQERLGRWSVEPCLYRAVKAPGICQCQPETVVMWEGAARVKQLQSS